MDEASKDLPSYIQHRPDREGLLWRGNDASLVILPHLRTNWLELSEAARRTGKPIGDLGGSFSTIPVEGELRDIRFVPIDIMHEYNRKTYDYANRVINNFLADYTLRELYENGKAYIKLYGMDTKKREPNQLHRDLKHAVDVVQSNLVVADLAKIPLADRSLAVSLVHDSIPKHSIGFVPFLHVQLPEILRVTDETAYIYPLKITKSVRYERKEEYDPDEDRIHYRWAVAQRPNDDDLAKGLQRDFLDTVLDISTSPEKLEVLRKKAEECGFEFQTKAPLIREFSNTDWRESDQQMVGIFRRK